MENDSVRHIVLCSSVLSLFKHPPWVYSMEDKFCFVKFFNNINPVRATHLWLSLCSNTLCFCMFKYVQCTHLFNKWTQHCARESLKCSHSLLWLSLSCLLWLTDDALKSETVTLMVCLRQSVHHTVYALIMLNTANYWCMLKYLVMRNHINFLPKCIFVNFCHIKKQTRQI